METQFLDRVRSALTAANFWSEFDTKWACLDCELMPWSAKAQELLKTQYAAVGAAGQAALPRAVASMAQAAGRLGGEDKIKVEQVMGECQRQEEHVSKFVTAFGAAAASLSSVGVFDELTADRDHDTCRAEQLGLEHVVRVRRRVLVTLHQAVVAVAAVETPAGSAAN